MKRAIAVFAAFLLLGSVPKPRPHPPAVAQNGWSMQTGDISANLKNGDFSAPSHVHMTRADGSTVDADRAEGNFKKKTTELYGHVVVEDASGNFNGVTGAAKHPRGPAHLACDTLHVDGKAKTYVADGNVHYAQSDSTADAQRAVLNERSHRLVMSGGVHLVRADRTMEADNMTYDTKTGDGVANTGVRMTFPGGAHPAIATPRPIVIKNPKIIH